MNRVWIGDDNKGTVNCPKCAFRANVYGIGKPILKVVISSSKN
jgi:hypothetical protein